jgi:flagella basal body P-ring formation protein FlgA
MMRASTYRDRSKTMKSIPTILSPILGLGLLAAPLIPAAAQNTPFIDPVSIEQAVAQFTGAVTGSAGGARGQIDRRLRLTRCTSPLDLRLYGTRQDSVAVSCPDPSGWRIFVPLVKAAAAPAAQELVGRGDIVSIAIEGRGFSVAQSGEALEGGAAGDWIRVKPPGKSEAIRARVERPGKVVIPM